MLSRISINQSNVWLNRQGNEPQPVLNVSDYRNERKGSSVVLKDKKGKVVAKFVYSPEAPLSNGAPVWMETELEVEVE